MIEHHISAKWCARLLTAVILVTLGVFCWLAWGEIRGGW